MATSIKTGLLASRCKAAVRGQFDPVVFLQWVNSSDNIYFKSKGNWLTNNGDNAISGILSFCIYRENGIYYLEEYCQGTDECLSGWYNVKIVMEKDRFPTVYETGGSMLDIAEKHSKSLENLHINDDGTCCLIDPIDQKLFLGERNTEANFIIKILIPFFKRAILIENNIPIPKNWGERGHGLIGILESYAENKKMVDDDMIEDLHKIFKGTPEDRDADPVRKAYLNILKGKSLPKQPNYYHIRHNNVKNSDILYMGLIDIYKRFREISNNRSI